MVYGLMLHKTYTSDHVCWIENQSNNGNNVQTMFWNSVLGGRIGNIFVEIINRFFALFGINKMHYQFVEQFFFIALILIASTELYFIFSELLQVEEFSLIIDLIILIGFINPFFVELLLWIGFEHGIAIVLSSVVALKLFNQKHYLMTGIVVFLALSIYQSYYEPFMIYAISYYFIKAECKFNKKLLKVYLRIFSISAIAVLASLSLTKIATFVTNQSEVKQTSISGNNGIFDKLISIFEWIYMIIVHSFGMLPPFFIISIFTIMICTILFYLHRAGKESIIVWKAIAICILIVFIPFSITLAMDAVALQQRTIVSYFMAVSMCFLLLYYLIKNTQIYDKCINKFNILLYIFLIVNGFCAETAILDLFISNTLDIAEARQVNTIIEQYEKDKNIEVTKIVSKVMNGSSEDKTYDYYYHMNYIGYVFMHKLNHDNWCNVELVNYFCDENYDDVEMTDEQYCEYFGDVLCTDVFNPDTQLVFEGNTLYWAIE